MYAHTTLSYMKPLGAEDFIEFFTEFVGGPGVFCIEAILVPGFTYDFLLCFWVVSALTQALFQFFYIRKHAQVGSCSNSCVSSAQSEIDSRFY